MKGSGTILDVSFYPQKFPKDRFLYFSAYFCHKPSMNLKNVRSAIKEKSYEKTVIIDRGIDLFVKCLCSRRSFCY